MLSDRLIPHFFILGERKCGTSSLYRYLLSHPQVLPGSRKEMQFFTRGPQHVQEHWLEYLAAFPLRSSQSRSTLDWPELDADGVLYEEKVIFERSTQANYVTGEASADTFADGDPALLHAKLPELRLLLLLRDPVQRAFSHHRMYARFQDEGRDLGFRVGDFRSDMQSEIIRASAGEKTPCLSPGLYLPPLLRWQSSWGPSNPLVLFSADLQNKERCPLLMSKAVHHLGLPEHDFGSEILSRYNQAPPSAIPAGVAAQLTDFYRPHSLALQDHLQQPLPWL